MAEQTEQLSEGGRAGQSDTKGREEKEEGGRECAVCLQTCVYPVQLPCGHIFCFLCVKGVTLQSKRCAMCRREIPQDYLHNPELLEQLEPETGGGFEDGGQWFYEGRNGWWLYDERTSQEIETAWSAEEQRCELLIAGFLYIIDFEHMLQYRRNDPSRRRRIKRDQASGPKKGVAGLRMEAAEEVAEPEDGVAGDNADGDNTDGGAVDGGPADSPAGQEEEGTVDDGDPAEELSDALGVLTVEERGEE